MPAKRKPNKKAAPSKPEVDPGSGYEYVPIVDPNELRAAFLEVLPASSFPAGVLSLVIEYARRVLICAVGRHEKLKILDPFALTPSPVLGLLTHSDFRRCPGGECVDVCPVRQWVVSCNQYSNVLCWHYVTQQAVSYFPTPLPVRILRVLPLHGWVAVVQGRSIVCYDLMFDAAVPKAERHAVTHRFKAASEDEPMNGLVLLPDRRRLVSQAAHLFRVWKLPPGRTPATAAEAVALAARKAELDGCVDSWEYSKFDEPSPALLAITSSIVASGVNDCFTRVFAVDTDGSSSGHRTRYYPLAYPSGGARGVRAVPMTFDVPISRAARRATAAAAAAAGFESDSPALNYQSYSVVLTSSGAHSLLAHLIIEDNTPLPLPPPPAAAAADGDAKGDGDGDGDGDNPAAERKKKYELPVITTAPVLQIPLPELTPASRFRPVVLSAVDGAHILLGGNANYVLVKLDVTPVPATSQQIVAAAAATDALRAGYGRGNRNVRSSPFPFPFTIKARVMAQFVDDLDGDKTFVRSLH